MARRCACAHACGAFTVRAISWVASASTAAAAGLQSGSWHCCMIAPVCVLTHLYYVHEVSGSGYNAPVAAKQAARECVLRGAEPECVVPGCLCTAVAISVYRNAVYRYSSAAWFFVCDVGIHCGLSYSCLRQAWAGMDRAGGVMDGAGMLNTVGYWLTGIITYPCKI